MQWMNESSDSRMGVIRRPSKIASLVIRNGNFVIRATRLHAFLHGPGRREVPAVQSRPLNSRKHVTEQRAHEIDVPLGLWVINRISL